MVLSPPEENESEPFRPFRGPEIDEQTAQTGRVIKLHCGKTQIITVNSLANKEDIMQKAKAKHASFDQSFYDTLQYCLLYPDFL